MAPAVKERSVSGTPTRGDLEVMESVAKHVLRNKKVWNLEEEDLFQELMYAGIKAYSDWNGGDGSRESGMSLRMWTLRAMNWHIGRLLDFNSRNCRAIHRFPMASVESIVDAEPGDKVDLFNPEDDSSRDPKDIARRKKLVHSLPPLYSEDRYALEFPDYLGLDEDQEKVLAESVASGLSQDPKEYKAPHRAMAREMDIPLERLREILKKLAQNEELREYLKSA